MAIRWVNNYHRGFNRLWLVLAVMGAFVFVTFNMLMGEYKVSKLPSVRYPLYRPDVAYRPDEDMIKQHAREQWRELNAKSTKDGLTVEEIEDISENKDKSKDLLESLRKRGLPGNKDEPKDRIKRRIFRSVKSMKEAKDFKKDELIKLIDEAIEKEKKYQDWVKTYPQRVWKARGRFVRDLLGTFIVTFVFGHGVFLVIYWIIIGFRKG